MAPDGEDAFGVSKPKHSQGGDEFTLAGQIVTCNALLFDLDGVLVDSTPAVARVWAQWARERGFDPDDVVRRAHGRPSLTTLRELLPHADHEQENREVERREIQDIDGIIPLPGTHALLASLPREQWAIVTSCTRPLAEVRIRAAGLPLPSCLITSSDVRHGKPHPEPYLLGATRLGYAPSDCIVVEDAPAGIRAGKGAGCRVIAFPATTSAQELRNVGCDWILKDCGSIQVVEKHGSSGSLSLRLDPYPNEVGASV